MQKKDENQKQEIKKLLFLIGSLEKENKQFQTF